MEKDWNKIQNFKLLRNIRDTNRAMINDVSDYTAVCLAQKKRSEKRENYVVSPKKNSLLGFSIR